MKSYILSTLLVCFTLVSCADSDKKTAIPESSEVHTGSPEGHLNLKHNNGSKWQANAETTEGVLAMQKHVTTFLEEESNDYTTLKTQLETEFAHVFEKCTMKGESHDQLHNFLYPMKALFEDLTKDPETAQKAVANLKQHIPVYFQYFE